MVENGRRELRAGLGYTIGNILIKGITFITLPIFSRILSTAQYGTFNTYMAYESILSIFIGLGMYASIKNAKFDFPGKVNEYVSTVLWITVIPVALCMILATVFSGAITKTLDLSQPLVFLLIFQSFGSAMLSISNARLALDYNYTKYLKFACFNTFVNTGLSVVLILCVFNIQREYGRIVGSAIPLVLIGVYVFITNGHSGNFSFNKKMARYALRVGFPLIWHYLSQQIQSQFDRIAITGIVGSSFTGIYSFAYSIASILQVVFYSTENVWSVWFFEQMSQGNYKKIREVSRKYMLLIASIATFMLVGSKEVIMLMGDREYWEGATIFIPILLGIFLLYLYTVPVAIEYYYKKTKYIAMMTGIAAVVNVALNYLLIPRFGYIAAAYTTLLSYAVQFVSHWIISKKILKSQGIDRVFYLSDIIKVFICVCIFGISVYLLNPVPLIKYIVFSVILAVVGYIHRDDLKLLYDTFVKKE